MINYKIYTKTRDKNGKQVRLYRCWSDMKSRCYNINDTGFNYYGKRGITVCDEWKNDYQIFRIWAVENGYKDNLTLDRINFKGNYEPSNCRWITIKEQQSNKCNNVYIEFDGETKTITEWCEKLNLNNKTIDSRINKLKTDPLIALGLKEGYKAKNKKYFIWEGEEKSYTEWCDVTGEKLSKVHDRINKLGWSVEKALGLTQYKQCN